MANSKKPTDLRKTISKVKIRNGLEVIHNDTKNEYSIVAVRTNGKLTGYIAMDKEGNKLPSEIHTSTTGGTTATRSGGPGRGDRNPKPVVVTCQICVTKVYADGTKTTDCYPCECPKNRT